MSDWLTSSLFYGAVLTLLAYEAGLLLQRRFKSALMNPILLGTVIVIAVNALTGASYAAYEQSARYFSWLLTPATICLAVPLYEQLKTLKKNLPAILAGITAGTVTSLLVVWLMCCLFSLDRSLTVSLLPKSITTAMGMVLSEQNGGIGALTTVVIIVTGILGSLMGPALCKLLRLHDPISQGVALGTASHVIGTSKANELGEIQGAVSSLSLACAGILTAIMFPIMMTLI